jgi:predicted ArsR family transcriptional regulator
MNSLDLFGSTRGEILAHLREQPRTVNDLAEQLGLTDNAIRAHLAELQEAGLVHHAGERLGTRKPHALYGLTARAQELMSRLYVPVLNTLFELLQERLPKEQVESLVRGIGRRLAAPHAGAFAQKSENARVTGAVQLLAELGGDADVLRRPEGTVIQGRACPLAAAVAEHPQVCGLVEAFLSELLQKPVKEECRKGPVARCCFRIEEEQRSS